MSGIGDLTVKIGADISGFLDGLNTINDKLEDFGGIIGSATKAIEAFAVFEAIKKVGETIFEMTARAAEGAEQIELLSNRVGISTQNLQSLDLAFQEVGLDVNTLAASARILSANMLSLDSPTSKAAAAFEMLGVEVKKGDDYETVLRKVADAANRMPDGFEKTALLTQIFGRQAGELIPILNQGSEGLDRAAQKAKEFGTVLSQDQMEAFKGYNDAWHDLIAAMSGFG